MNRFLAGFLDVPWIRFMAFLILLGVGVAAGIGWYRPTADHAWPTVLVFASLVGCMALIPWRRIQRSMRSPVDEAGNARFAVREGWSRWILGSSDAASFAFRRGTQRCRVIVTSECRFPLPEAGEMANSRLEQLEQSLKEMQVVERVPLRLGDQDGVFVEATGIKGHVKMRHASFSMATRGFKAEFIVWGPQDSFRESTPRATLEGWVSGFERIHPERSVYGEARLQSVPLQDAAYGIRFDVGDPSSWHVRPPLGTEMELAAFGAYHRDGFALSVMPVWLPDVDMEFDVVARACLETFGVDADDGSHIFRGGGEGEGTQWRQMIATRTFSAVAVRTGLHVLRRGRLGVVLALSGEPGHPQFDRRFDEAVQALQVARDTETLAPKPGQAPGAPRDRTVQLALSRRLDRRGVYRAAVDVLASLKAMRPDDEEVAVEHLHLLCRNGAYEEAESVLAELPDMLRERMVVRACVPFLAVRRGRVEEGIAAYRALFSDGWRDLRDFEDFIQQLERTGELEEALREVETWRAREDAPALRAMATRLHRDLGTPDEALAMWEAFVTSRGGAAEARADRAYALTVLERYEPAVHECETLLESGYRTKEVSWTKGMAELRLGWLSAAKATFDAALKLDPDDKTTLGWIDRVRSEFGQGNQQAIREPLVGLELPAPSEWAAPAEFASAGAVHLERTQVTQFLRGVGERRTWRHRVLLQSASAVTHWSTYAIGIDPESERLWVHELVVRDGNGDVVSTGSSDDWFVQDEGRDGHSVRLPVPGLVAGYTFEVAGTIERFGRPERFRPRQIQMDHIDPTVHMRVELRGDVDDLVVHAEGDVSVQRDVGVVRCEVRDVSAAPDEPYAPRRWAWRPTLVVGESEGMWDEVATGYLERIAEPLNESSESVDALAQRLTDGLETDEEKAALLTAYVREEVTYHSLPFGPRAWKPDAASKVLSDRYGDCKGQSLLLRQLLRAANVDCHLALVHAGHLFVEEIASEWQFNHMINYLPTVGGGRFVDCVDETLSFDVETPDDLEGQTALILDPEAPRLRRIPMHASSMVQVERTLSWTGDEALLSEQATFYGATASRMRGWLRGVEPPERKSRVERLFQHHRVLVRIDALETSNPTSATPTFDAQVTGRLVGGFDHIAGRVVGRVPIAWEEEFLAVVPPDVRRAPMCVRHPHRIVSRIHVRPPEGWSVSTEAEPNASGEGPHYTWARSWERRDSSLVLEFQADLVGGQSPPEAFARHAAAARESLDALAVPVVFAAHDT